MYICILINQYNEVNRYDKIWVELIQRAWNESMDLEQFQNQIPETFLYTNQLKEQRKEHRTVVLNTTIREDVINILDNLTETIGLSKSIITEVALYKLLFELNEAKLTHIKFTRSVENTDQINKKD